jgi:hypothetical protein
MVFLKSLCAEESVNLCGVIAVSTIPAITGARIARWVLSAMDLDVPVGLRAIALKKTKVSQRASLPVANGLTDSDGHFELVYNRLCSERFVTRRIFLQHFDRYRSTVDSQKGASTELARQWWIHNIADFNPTSNVPATLLDKNTHLDHIVGSQYLLQTQISLCPAHSMVIVVNSAMTDLSMFLANTSNRELFAAKVARVVVQGGVMVDSVTGKVLINDNGVDVIDESSANNKADLAAAKFVYSTCHSLKVPIWTFGRHGAAQSAVTSELFVQVRPLSPQPLASVSPTLLLTSCTFA